MLNGMYAMSVGYKWIYKIFGVIYISREDHIDMLLNAYLSNSPQSTDKNIFIDDFKNRSNMHLVKLLGTDLISLFFSKPSMIPMHISITNTYI